MNKFAPFDKKPYVGIQGYGLGGLSITYTPTQITCKPGTGQTIFLAFMCAVFTIVPIIIFFTVEDFRDEVLDLIHDVPWIALAVFLFISVAVFFTLKYLLRRPKMVFNKLRKTITLSSMSNPQENFVVLAGDVQSTEIITKHCSDSDGNDYENFILLLNTRHGPLQLCITEKVAQLEKLGTVLDQAWGL